MKCTDCKKEFSGQERGYKKIPKPLCPDCVLTHQIITCPNCDKVFHYKKEGYLDACWICDKEGCTFCLRQVTIKGTSFGFCEEHRDYDKKQLKKDAEDLFEDEK